MPSLFLAALLAAGTARAGSVRVSATREGARILVDGGDTGQRTPAVVRELPPGVHEVRAVDGCLGGLVRVDVPAEGEVEVTLELEPQGGELVVQPVPAEATVDVDGQPLVGPVGAPAPVTCGSHTVVARQEGYQTALLTVDVGPWERVVLPIEMVPLGRGWIDVDVVPDEAAIAVDGSEIGRGRVSHHPLPAGPHVLAVEAEGYTPYEKPFVLRDGQALPFTVSLERVPVASGRRPAALTATGVGLVAGGVVAGVVAGIEYARTVAAYDEYAAAMDEANAAADEAMARRAQRYYSTDVLPHLRNTRVAAAVSAGMMLGGVVVFVAF